VDPATLGVAGRKHRLRFALGGRGLSRYLDSYLHRPRMTHAGASGHNGIGAAARAGLSRQD
jgi:hypothetical protein